MFVTDILTPTWTVVMAESGFPVCARYWRGPSYLHHNNWIRDIYMTQYNLSPVQLSLAGAARPALRPRLEVIQLYPLILSRPVIHTIRVM